MGGNDLVGTSGCLPLCRLLGPRPGLWEEGVGTTSTLLSYPEATEETPTLTGRTLLLFPVSNPSFW